VLASHNILNPANGAQLLYLLRTWFWSILYDQRTFVNSRKKILGQDYSILLKSNIALNEGRLELNARVKLEQKILMKLRIGLQIQTTAGRVFLMKLPEAAGYINDVLTKKNLEILVTY
jgi:DNA-directed RNA polymerase subunit beta'